MTITERPVIGVKKVTPENTGEHSKVDTIHGEFKRLGDKPMGNDVKMGAFYQAAEDLLHTNPQFKNFIKDASQRDITPSHFSNLILRGVQYVEIYEKSRTEYGEEFKDPEAWKELLVGEEGILNTPEQKAELEDILETKETTTTIYQRYAGVKMTLNALFPDKQVAVADFGCGANYGLMGLRGNIPFKDVVMESNGHPQNDVIYGQAQVKQLLDTPVNLKEGFAVDKNDPAGEENRKWRTACSFYPKELTPENLKELNDLEDTIEGLDKEGMKFLHGDLLHLETNHADGTLPEGHFDAVVMSTILYQMNEEQQKHMIETAKATLNENGVIIMQDFGKKDPENPIGLHVQGLSSEPFSYRTFVMGKEDTEWKEFMKFYNGRCRSAQMGEDFNQVLAPRKEVQKELVDMPVDPIVVFSKAAQN